MRGRTALYPRGRAGRSHLCAVRTVTARAPSRRRPRRPRGLRGTWCRPRNAGSRGARLGAAPSRSRSTPSHFRGHTLTTAEVGHLHVKTDEGVRREEFPYSPRCGPRSRRAGPPSLGVGLQPPRLHGWIELSGSDDRSRRAGMTAADPEGIADSLPTHGHLDRPGSELILQEDQHIVRRPDGSASFMVARKGSLVGPFGHCVDSVVNVTLWRKLQREIRGNPWIRHHSC